MLKAMIVATALLGAAPALGQTAAQATAPQVDVDKDIKRLFEEGQAAAAAQQWDKARIAFAKAWALLPLPQIARHLGRAEIRSGDFVAGIEHLQAFLKEKPAADPVEIEAIQELLTEAKAKVATVTLKVEQTDADVLVDGRAIEEKFVAGPILLLAGAHTFEVRKKGYLGVPQHLALSAGDEVGVFLNLVPMRNAHVDVATAPVGAPTKWLIPAMAIGSGALAAAGIGSLAWSKVERDRVKSEFPCHSDVACDKLRERGAQSIGFAYGSLPLFIGAGVGGVSALIAWAGVRKSPTGAAESRKTSLLVVPTLGGIGVRGAW